MTVTNICTPIPVEFILPEQQHSDRLYIFTGQTMVMAAKPKIDSHDMNNTNSFFTVIGNRPVNPELLAKNFGSGAALSDQAEGVNVIYFNQDARYDTNDFSVYIFGNIQNPGIIGPGFNTATIALLKGNFACILFEKKSKLLHLYLSITGQIPAYIISQGDQIFITSRLSAFHRTDLFNRQLIPIRQYQYAFTDKTPLDFSLMQQCKRAIPGILYSFSTGKKPELTGQAILKQIAPGRINMDKKAAQEKLQELLYDHIRQTAVAGQAVAVPVSGGVDSGTIAGILKNEKTDLHTYSIGTEFGNEFPAARITADFCGSIHVEITLDDADFVEGLLHSVYYNEIFDPLYAEGFVAFYQVLKQASGVAGIIYTGYGADLVMGNILKEKDIQKIQQANASWCRRTSWTGELSPYLPAIFNSELHYPFWSEDMIDLGLSMPPEWLQQGHHDKFILRELSEEKKWTHPDIAWNKKTALTHGTSLDRVFSKLLNLKNNTDYGMKSRFIYYLFEAFFVHDKTIGEIDIHMLIRKTGDHDNITGDHR